MKTSGIFRPLLSHSERMHMMKQLLLDLGHKHTVTIDENEALCLVFFGCPVSFYYPESQSNTQVNLGWCLYLDLLLLPELKKLLSDMKQLCVSLDPQIKDWFPRFTVEKNVHDKRVRVQVSFASAVKQVELGVMDFATRAAYRLLVSACLEACEGAKAPIREDDAKIQWSIALKSLQDQEVGCKRDFV